MHSAGRTPAISQKWCFWEKHTETNIHGGTLSAATQRHTGRNPFLREGVAVVRLSLRMCLLVEIKGRDVEKGYCQG